MEISTANGASNVISDKYHGRLGANFKLSEDIVLDDTDGHPTIYASLELSKAILDFLATL
jgi:hypothetical protein